jgi:hypothetical protein
MLSRPDRRVSFVPKPPLSGSVSNYTTKLGEKLAGATPLSSIEPPPESASSTSPSTEVPRLKVWPCRSRRSPSANEKPSTWSLPEPAAKT